MQQDASNARQLIIERVRQSTNILVAVSANPSVDALAGALGFALMLNKMDKHATAVFSGAMPPAMDFLSPGKTFEHSVDSLRDFIISLDKEKADRLRYKVEDDVVRIFITPYRTIISEKDLQFSQGDFNVDLIVALGVEKREDLDRAIIAHGRILHDATVVTINAGNQQSSLGAVDWHEPSTSSLCEMLVSIAEALQKPGLVDQQIATALLTGIVAATDRFSNAQTSPKVMTMAAQLMAAGANQQLIANNLVKAHEMSQQPGNGQLLPGAASVKVAVPGDDEQQPPKEDGELDIVHLKKAPEQEPVAEKPQQQPEAPKQSQQPKGRGRRQHEKFKQSKAEEELAAALPAPDAAATGALDQLEEAVQQQDRPQEPQGKKGGPKKDESAEPNNNPGWRGRRLEPPAMGGTLNATAEEAMDETRKAQEAERNQQLLTHPDDTAGQVSKAATIQPPMPKLPQTPQNPTPADQPMVMAGPESDVSKAAEPQVTEPAPATAPAPEPTPAPVEPAPAPELPPSLPPIPEPPAPAPQPEPAMEPAPLAQTPPNPEPAPALPAVKVDADLNAARDAVSAALASQPFDPSGQPLQSVGAMPLDASGPLPPPAAAEVSPLPAPEATPAPNTFAASPEPVAQPQPETGLNTLPPLPPMPPLPSQDAGQPLPPPPSLDSLPPIPGSAPVIQPIPPPTQPPQPPASADPKQFQIPGAP